MMCFYKSVLGCLEHPFTTSRKCVGEVALAGLASAGLSALSADITNRRNREWQEEMWNKQNRYNTPAAQVERLRKAGMNPALAMEHGAIGSGTADAVGSPAVQQGDFSPIAQGMRDSIELYQQKRLQDSQIDSYNADSEGRRIQNRTQLIRDLAELYNTFAKTRESDKNREWLQKQIDYKMKEIDAFDDRNGAEVERIRNESAKAHWDAEISRITAGFKPKEQDLLLKNLKAQEQQILAAARAGNAQAAHSLALKALTDAQKDGVSLDNDIKEQTADAVVDQAFTTADESYWNSQQVGKRFAEGKLSENLPSSYIEDGYSGSRVGVRQYRRDGHTRRKFKRSK